MMARALRLARRSVSLARPNPAVGCVLVRDGSVIGEGRTQAAGGNHAEIDALSQVQDARGATAYVTLEPCSHSGRTGPCADALVAAGVSAVHAAMLDPNPEVAGKGMAKLEAAGIVASCGLLAAQAEQVNAGFYQRMRTGRPRVRVKLATSLDGRTAMASGESQWITGAAARSDVQKLRAQSGAIVTGIGTVLHDDPALTVRDGTLDIPSQPLRVILDSRLRTPVDASILDQPGHTLVVHGSSAPVSPELAASRAELLALSTSEHGIDLPALLETLAQRQCNDILVECGARLAGAFVEQRLADELVVYMAPTMLGSDARPLLALPLSAMDEQVRFNVQDVRAVGDDWRWILLPRDADMASEPK